MKKKKINFENFLKMANVRLLPLLSPLWAMDVKDFLEGVEHVLKALRGRFDDFSDDVRAYLQNFSASVHISQSIEGLYRER